ncbi:FecR family protein [Dyadobacter aurulentus]|uniref:FecR family protein n=1 Tax=Dyadobacter sp. UC 10 TaxID=2605428 RepID=UPI001788DEB6|nr:FecR family protein [Dyadobacter sp. UC 10]
MRYDHFRVPDFVSDPRFRSWVLDNDPDATAFWNKWLKEHPEKQEEVEEAKALLYVLAEKRESVDQKEIDQRVAITLDQIKSQKSHHERIDAYPRSKPVVRSRPLLFALVAASILLVMFAGWFLSEKRSVPSQSSIEVKAGFVITRSSDFESKNILLKDGSKIVLAPGSELRYPQVFDAAIRQVHLNGEAFFEIARDTKRPFKVIAPDLVTEVLGTSFMVRSFKSSPEALVSVKTGKVSVLTHTPAVKTQNVVRGEMNGMILNPNQEAVYSRNGARLVKRLVLNPQVVIVVPEKKLIFDAAPVSDVLSTLSERYGVSIVYQDDLLADCFFTGDLTGNSLYEQLDFVSRIANARYDIVEGQIIFHSTGCPETN